MSEKTKKMSEKTNYRGININIMVSKKNKEWADAFFQESFPRTKGFIVAWSKDIYDTILSVMVQFAKEFAVNTAK